MFPSPPPFFVNTAVLTSFDEGKENYVKVTFGFYCPVPKIKNGKPERDVLGKVILLDDFAVPTVTVMMTKISYKFLFKQFQAFLAKQEEEKIGGEEVKI